MAARVAIVVDWLATAGGAERVLAEMLALYPDADLYSLVDFYGDRRLLGERRITTSPLQTLPMARHWFRAALGIMPMLIEQWRFHHYDLVLSSSHAVAKGIIAGPDQVHVSYIHTPMRYAWDLQDQYLHGETGRWMRRWMLHRLRLWDQLSAARPDLLLANSHFIARRIARHWNRPAEVIYPPVDIERFQPGGASSDFYLTVSRLVPYKRVDLLLDAFAAMPERRLVVIGDGPEMPALRRRAPANVTLLGQQPDSVVDQHMAACRAYIIAAEEDFGIAPLEAQACGKPVIALGRGGACETLAGPPGNPPTAMFFDQPTAAAIRQAVAHFEADAVPIQAAACRANAERFAPAIFRQRFAAAVQRAIAEHQQRRCGPVAATGADHGG